MKTKAISFTLGYLLAASLACHAAESLHPLWQIGQADQRAAEFALSPSNYPAFLQQFGSPDHAYYVGVSKPESDWPYVLPGPSDGWGGSSGGGRWDQMNTLPIGFVLAQAATADHCKLVLNIADTRPERPPRLRITINGTVFNRELSPGGSEDSLRGHLGSAKPQVVEVEFPATLLRPGYNEIALRSTGGSWLVFDALRLEVPSEVRLASPANTVIRSVTTTAYAVSAKKNMPATIRLEVFRASSPGRLKVEVESGGSQELDTQPGLQVFEIPAPTSAPGKGTHFHVSADGQLLHESQLNLRASPPAAPADYVDVFKGTAHSRWMIGPGPSLPFSMVKISPDNQTAGWCSGYEYSIEQIDCFSHIHEWTMAGLGMMPTLGPLRTKPGLDGTGYSSRFNKVTERGGIGFYEVLLKDTGIRVALTASTRASLQEYTFPASDQARVIFDFDIPTEYKIHVLDAKVRRTGPAEIEGTIQTDVPEVHYNGDQRYDLHFVTQFSRPFDSLGGWQEEEVFSNAPSLKLVGDCGAFVEFKTRGAEKVLARTGISLVSVANARLNLEQELAKPFGWDFAAVVQNQRRVWNQIFDHVEIQTPDAREKCRFYSNLYRALSGRNTWSDVNGEWTDPDERTQKLTDPDTVMLGCDAFWTTFWNMNQVMNLLAPEWSARWVKSELQLYDKCGWLSKGPGGLEYISVMVAEHEIPLMVAAYQHGVKGVDRQKVLEAAVKMQTTLPQLYPGGGAVGNENLENYLKHGYVASDGPVVQGKTKGEWRMAWGSNTYEYSYDDWCVAQLALALGRKDLAEQFLKRSRSWRNSFDVETGFARPRKANGEWVTPFDPYHTPGFVEGNAWQYTWFVPQDVPGLVNVMGRDRFVSRLNEAFEKSAPTRFNAAGERFADFPINQGNQTTMHVAWLFNWAGQPWMSQKWARAILGAYYGHNPADAYLGDEDQGQMSSWFVMSSLGLFQTDGGCRVNPIYEIGSPLYPKVVLHLSKEHYGGKTFTITARNASKQNRFIQSARLNGKPLNQWWLRQKEILQGGRLELELGPAPNREWAKGCPLPD
ncbi:MAG: glycoside hydrolase family 92 protein [Verrucomicrobia bacterium]|nr:glycoside hydrolase family 92 protein [Verrucomicrobiota bacterium]